MKLKYNWGNDYRVLELLTKIYANSIKKLEENGYHGESYALEFIRDIEEFLYGVRVSFSSCFDNIVDSLNNLEGLSFVPMREGIGFPVKREGNTILIDPSAVVNNGISCSANFKKICVFYGLSLVAVNLSNDKTAAFTQMLDDDPLSKEMTKTYINDGWMLLQEVLAEQLAKIVYNNLLRWGYISETDNQDIIVGRKLSVHSEDYTSFDILIRFGLTISREYNLLEYSNEATVLNMLRRATAGNLSEEIIMEYTARGLVNELYSVLYDMGEIHYRRKRTYPLVLLDDYYEKDIYINLLLKLNRLINFSDDYSSPSSRFVGEGKQTSSDKTRVKTVDASLVVVKADSQ